MFHPQKLGIASIVALICFALAGCGKGSADTVAPALGVSPATLQFSANAAQQADPPPATIAVANSGSGNLTFSASTDVAWLAVTPTGGSAPESLQVTAMIGSLAPGTYTGHVAVTSNGVQGSPASVGVTFTVAPVGKP